MGNLAEVMVNDKDSLASFFKFSQRVHDDLFTDRVNPHKGLV